MFELKREFAVILSAVALPIVLKAEFNFEPIRTLSFLFSKVQAAALNPLSVSKTFFSESAPIALFSSRLREGNIIHKKCLRAPFTLIFHSILRPPKHRLTFFLSISSAKEVICPV